MKLIHLGIGQAKSKAHRKLRDLEDGKFTSVDDLEVLDAVLDELDKKGEKNVTFISGGKKFDLETIRRLRMKRGLDPRPKKLDL